MPILLLIWNNKRWFMIVLLCIVIFCQLAYTNHLSKELRTADEQCTAKIQKIKQANLKALTTKQNEINKVSADYETLKSEQRVQVETITREVQKIIEHPVYLNNCFDAAGLQQLNSLIASGSGESP